MDNQIFNHRRSTLTIEYTLQYLSKELLFLQDDLLRLCADDIDFVFQTETNGQHPLTSLT